MLRRFTALKTRLLAIRPFWILLATWLVVIAYAFPGYMNWDTGDQLWGARRGRYDDWHPPLMAAYWHVIEYLVRGPFGMLLLQSTLFLFGLFAVFRERFAERTAALLAAGLMLFPPVLTPMAPVWKDAQMAGFLIAGTMLAIRRSWWSRGLGIAMLMFAAGVRDNGATALPPLCLLIVASWHLVRNKLAVGAIAIGLFLVVTFAAMTINSGLTNRRNYAWYKTVAIHDLAGVVCLEDPMTDDEVRRFLDGIVIVQPDNLQARFCNAYNPRVWFPLTFGGVDINMFSSGPEKPDRLARRRAWRLAVREHASAFIEHRWRVTKEVLGLTDSDPWEPVCQTITANPDHGERISHVASLSWFQSGLGSFIQDHLTRGLLYRPWAYLVVGFILLGYALHRRDGLLCGLLGSGILYEASYVIGAAAPDFRYSHWLVVCVCVTAVIVFGERLRSGLRARAR